MKKRMNWAADDIVVWYSFQNAGAGRALMPQGNQNNLDSDDGEFYTGGSWQNGTNRPPYFWWDFGEQATIDQIGWTFNYGGTITASVSDDSTNGFDGTWTPVLTDYAYSAGSRVDYIPVTTPTSGKWFRIICAASCPSYTYNYRLFLYGDYDVPQFELWNTEETLEYTNEMPLAFPNAYSNTPYDSDLVLKIKNLDTVLHSYSIEVFATSAAGDTFVTTYFTAIPSTITDLAGNGAFSVPILINGTVSEANNPGDGEHYLKVRITETS